MKMEPIKHLSALINNGIEVEPGQKFPGGFDPNGRRCYHVATEEMIAEARRLGRAQDPTEVQLNTT